MRVPGTRQGGDLVLLAIILFLLYFVCAVSLSDIMIFHFAWRWRWRWRDRFAQDYEVV